MKVYVNQEGELAIGEIWSVGWCLFNGRERFYSTKHPLEWGWTYIGELDG